MDWVTLLFSYEGRINRAKFWLAVLVYFVAGIVGAIIGTSVSYTLGNLLERIVDLACFVSGIFVCIKRLHDRDKSGWLLLLFYIAPIVLITVGIIVWVFGALAGSGGSTGWLILLAGVAIGIWGFVELGCLRGTIGPNQYGPDPLAPPAQPPTMAPPPPSPAVAPPPPPPTMAPPPPPPRPQ